MSSSPLDAIILGAGPAGASAAWSLANCSVDLTAAAISSA